jgi:hypothetical protein
MCNIKEAGSFHYKSKVHFSFSQFYIAEISLQQFREYFPFFKVELHLKKDHLFKLHENSAFL